MNLTSLRQFRVNHPARPLRASLCLTMSSKQTTPAQAIDFLTLSQNLKLTKRTGWIRMGISGPESIADHMYRMGLMALLAGDAGVDSTKCLKLTLAHDLAEAIVGDITPCDGIDKEEKCRRETEAMQQIRTMIGYDTLPDGRLRCSFVCQGASISSLWQEYEDGQTPEAKLVKDFDKLEMILQAHEYESAQGANLQEFFDSTNGKFTTPLGQAWAEEIVSRRPKQTTP